MCLDTSAFFDKSWLDSVNEEEETPAPARVPDYTFHWDLTALFANPAVDDRFWQVQVPEPFAFTAPVQEPAPVPEPAQAPVRAAADAFVLSIETELYAAVMYDKRKLIHHHALSQI